MGVLRILSFVILAAFLLVSCKKEPVSIVEDEKEEEQTVLWNPTYCKDLLGTYRMVSICDFYDLTDTNNPPGVDEFNVTFTLDTNSVLFNPDSFLSVSNTFISSYAFDNYDPNLNLTVENGLLTFTTYTVEGRLNHNATCDTLTGFYTFGYFDGVWDCDSVLAIRVN